MIKLKLVLVLIFALWSFSSCDTLYNYSYQVTNNTDAEVKIELKAYQVDSLYTINLDETAILFITDHGIEGKKGPYFEDVSFDLDYFVVTKVDSLISNRNYLDNSSWDYKDGLYTTTISNDEFD